MKCHCPTLKSHLSIALTFYWPVVFVSSRHLFVAEVRDVHFLYHLIAAVAVVVADAIATVDYLYSFVGRHHLRVKRFVFYFVRTIPSPVLGRTCPIWD